MWMKKAQNGYYTKLYVEVVDAHKLMPKDRNGTISAYVQVEFNNQSLNTQTVVCNLNPIWNETLSFNLDSSSKLKLRVYHDKKTVKYESEIGVKIYYVDEEDYHVSTPIQEHILLSLSSLPPPPEIEEEKSIEVTTQHEIEIRQIVVYEIFEEPLTPTVEPQEELPLRIEEIVDQANPSISTTRKVLRKLLDCKKFLGILPKRG
ncbi:hypothetical protein TanjilG_05240 [Lupinus angustifolius]|uniref:C2 domain-containing protein n=1 Tax=Lupinus angustifolius TaxID=3871 RepID=A0A4P1RBI0_LUPAN|nr:hypothetical protein TanjilG_05240 [Lupinus angustifolius]